MLRRRWGGLSRSARAVLLQRARSEGGRTQVHPHDRVHNHDWVEVSDRARRCDAAAMCACTPLGSEEGEATGSRRTHWPLTREMQGGGHCSRTWAFDSYNHRRHEISERYCEAFTRCPHSHAGKKAKQRRHFMIFSLVAGLHVSPTLRHGAIKCCISNMPPAMKDADAFARGPLSGNSNAWWRQDPTQLELVVELPEDASFKRDVSIEITRKRISVSVLGTELLAGELSHDVAAGEAEWYATSTSSIRGYTPSLFPLSTATPRRCADFGPARTAHVWFLRMHGRSAGPPMGEVRQRSRRRRTHAHDSQEPHSQRTLQHLAQASLCAGAGLSALGCTPKRRSMQH